MFPAKKTLSQVRARFKPCLRFSVKKDEEKAQKHPP
jgi:hypothetical protein